MRIIHTGRIDGSCGITKRSGHMMCGAPLSSTSRSRERLAHQRELAVLEVAQAAVDQLGRRRRGVRGEVVLLAQQDARAAAGEVAGDAGAVDAAADDEHVDLVARRRGRARFGAGVGIATILASAHSPEETVAMPNAKTHLLALDQGTSSSRAIVFDARGRDRRARRSASSARSFRSPAGSSTTRARSGARSSRPRARRSPRPALGARDIAAHRHHQPARDHVVWDRATGEPIGNAIVWQDRRTAPACDALKRARPRAALPRAHRPRARRLLLRHQARLAARPRAPARAPRRERGELAFGTVDTLADLARLHAAARRVHATDVEQRVAHAAVRHPHAATGTTSCSRARRAARAAARGASVEPRLRPHARPTCSARRSPIGGVAGDQQSALFGQACFARRPWPRTPTAPAASC